MSNWKLLVNGSDQPSVAISQIVQSTLAKAGINIELDVKQGAEFIDALLGGRFDAVFGGIGNIQKFPTRVATNSIYRTANNPVLGDAASASRICRGDRAREHDASARART